MAARVDEGRAVQAGDIVVITGHRLGEVERTGEILEVLGAVAKPHYRVRWEDGHETVFYPGSDASVRPAGKRTAKTK